MFCTAQVFPHFTQASVVKKEAGGQTPLEFALSKGDAENLRASTPLLAWLSTWVVAAGLPMRVVDHEATRELCNSLLGIAFNEKKQVRGIARLTTCYMGVLALTLL